MQPAPRPELCYTARIGAVTIRKSRPSGKKKLRPSHDTLENPQNTHNRPPPSPGKDQEADKRVKSAKRKKKVETRLFGGGRVLGDSLGTLRDGMLGQFAGQHEPDRGLDLAGGDGGLLVVAGKAGRLHGELLKDVVDEGVHDRHRLRGDSSIRVDLFHHLVDVDRETLATLALALLLVRGTHRLLRLTRRLFADLTTHG